MKPPSGNMGGGYRKKAEQDTLGRNSRLRYPYIFNDKRMLPYSNARVRTNQNKPIGRTSQPNLGQTPKIIDWDIFEVESYGHYWQYKVNWTVDNPTDVPLTYGVIFTYPNGHTNYKQTYTVSANSTKTETGQFVNVSSVYQTTEVGTTSIFQITLFDKTANTAIFHYDPPAVHLYDFTNISITNQQIDNSTRGRLVYSATISDTTSTNHRATTYRVVVKYKKTTDLSYVWASFATFTTINDGLPKNYSITSDLTLNIEEGTAYDIQASVLFLNSLQTPRDLNRLGQDLYTNYEILAAPTTGTTPPPTLNDIIGTYGFQFNNNQILDQVAYYQDGGSPYGVTRAFNTNYKLNNEYRDWVAATTADNSILRLWAWIDLQQVRTIRRIRLWQHDNVPHAKHRVKNVMFYVTNDASEASGEWSGAHTFDFSNATHRAKCDLIYTNDSGTEITYDAVNDYDDIGRDSPTDPTIAVTGRSYSGYWEFRVDAVDNNNVPNFHYMDRSGRYLYLRFDRRFPSGQPRIMQAQVLGY